MAKLDQVVNTTWYGLHIHHQNIPKKNRPAFRLPPGQVKRDMLDVVMEVLWRYTIFARR